MQQIDSTAIEQFGIPRLLLMEHAGLAVARKATALLPRRGASIVVACGTGYNGGDGLCAARHLHESGYGVHVLVTGRVLDLREEPAIYATILQRLGIPPREVTSVEAVSQATGWIDDSRLIIDALLGIGVQGMVREPTASLITLMNRSGKPILAVDIPSGLNADTGEVQGTAIHATSTVSFGLPKRGCFLGAGPEHAGELMVDPISIPRALLEVKRP